MVDPSAPGDPPALDPDSVARREFTTTFRGFDQVEVRAFLNLVGMRLREVLDREQELARRLDEAEARLGDGGQLDEDRLTALLGEETTRILDAAREAAAEIRARAEAKTAQLVREAQEESSRMTSEAAEVLRLRTSEAETQAAAIRSDAAAGSERMLADAGAEAEALVVESAAEAERLRGEARQVLEQAEIDAAAAVEEGRRQGRDMVAEAQVVRERILKDLARRRRMGKAQLEQLRAARERLLEAYALVRRTLEEATTELSVALPEAKLAAEAAARRLELDEDELTVEAIEAELDAGRVAGVPLLDTGEVPVAQVALPEPEVEPDPAVVPESEAVPEPETAVVAPDQAEPEVAEEAAGVDVADVEDLFARIRSEVPEQPSDPVEAEEGSGEGSEEGSGEGREERAGEDPVEPVDPREAVLERRDRVTVEIEHELGRSLKRVLADDENDKLDLIRRRSPKTPATQVLPDLAEHRRALVDASSEHLEAAARGGAAFAVEWMSGGEASVKSIRPAVVEDLAVELSDTLLAQIRERMLSLVEGSEGDEAADAIRATYRSWKSKVPEIAEQYVHTAFNRGVFDAVPDGATVSWVVEAGSDPCPDGEDDALAGAIAKGEQFPTGHLHPPAHPRCRCLLVPGVL